MAMVYMVTLASTFRLLGILMLWKFLRYGSYIRYIHFKHTRSQLQGHKPDQLKRMAGCKCTCFRASPA